MGKSLIFTNRTFVGNMAIIDLAQILSGKSTYPTWSYGRTYPLEITAGTDLVKVTYKRKNGGKRPIGVFPRYVQLSPKLMWVFGFLRGEGSRSKGSSAYRRFTATNADPEPLRLVLSVLQETGLLHELPNGCLKINRNDSTCDRELLDYWSAELGVPEYKFYFPPKPDEIKHARFGVCHIYISNVLLRLVIDAIAEYILDTVKRS